MSLGGPHVPVKCEIGLQAFASHLTAKYERHDQKTLILVHGTLWTQFTASHKAPEFYDGKMQGYNGYWYPSARDILAYGLLGGFTIPPFLSDSFE